MDINYFWSLTPYEFFILAEAYADKLKREQEEKIVLAYMTAYWTAQWFGKRKPKSLESILGIKKEKKIMTDQEMYEKVKLLHKALGGE